jgi:hypoxanthine phosphoribosyltransferase
MKKPFKPIKTALRDYPEWEDYLPRKTDKKVLIVDDVCDSGETFHKIRNHINERNVKKENGVDVRFAVLWWNNECNFEPHYYAQEIAKDSTNTWINFCWEAWWNTPV